LTLTIRKIAEEERQIVRRVPNKGQDDMANEMVLPRAGTIASWIRNTMTEMNKAYGLAIAAFTRELLLKPEVPNRATNLAATSWQRTHS
jgi:hypothetical protein